MNKTININLGGFFFHIDENAYQKLKRYLDAIARSLSDDAQGKNEIIADIEARISELLSEKITDARQVVNENDIDEIIKIMGQPEDYASTDDDFSQSSTYSYERNYQTGKKLFRDGEDKFLGGVAAGFAHYIGVDAIWVRLALLALFFGGGIGFLIYIILWILLPEAKTTAEKLQMEGTPVNIDNIERKIREEFKNVSENVKNAANQASAKFKEGATDFTEKVNETFTGKAKKNNSLEQFFITIGNIFLVFFKIIGKFIGFILVFVAAIVILSLVIGGFSVGSLEFLELDGTYLHYPPFFHNSLMPVWLITLFSFILIGIPFLVLLILGLRLLSSSVKRISKATSLILLGIWLTALLSFIFVGLEFMSSHAATGTVKDKIDITIDSRDTLQLKMVNNDEYKYLHNFKRSTHTDVISIDGKKVTYSNYIKVDVKKSETNEAYFTIEKESKGRNKGLAKENAKEIQYGFILNEHHQLILDAYFLSDYQNVWREEQIHIIIYMPEGMSIYIDNSAKNFLYYTQNKQDMYHSDMGNHYFIMNDVMLECTDCTKDLVEDYDNEI